MITMHDSADSDCCYSYFVMLQGVMEQVSKLQGMALLEPASRVQPESEWWERMDPRWDLSGSRPKWRPYADFASWWGLEGE